MTDQPEPHRLTDDELLSWLVVEAYRQLQYRDGITMLLHPWPPCPVCNSRTTDRIMRTSSTFDTTKTMTLEPCGHTLVAREIAIAANWPLAEATAKQIAHTPAGTRAADEYTTAKKPSTADQPDLFRLLLDRFTENAVQATRAKRADRSDEARAAHQTIAAVWTQAAHLLTQTIKQADNPVACPDCAVQPGQVHADGCDVARCPTTGRQRLTCNRGDTCGDRCRTRWTGQWPETAARDAELEQLRAEVAAFRVGEEQPTDERLKSTPANWIWCWNRATPEERLAKAATAIQAVDQAERCFLNEHASLHERLSAMTRAHDRVSDHARRLEDVLERARAECSRQNRSLEEVDGEPLSARDHGIYQAVQRILAALNAAPSCAAKTPASDDAPRLVHVGWYCWRCRAINAQACRSDCVPVHVPAEWADDMNAELAAREDDREPNDTDLTEADIDRMMLNAEPVDLAAPPGSLRARCAAALREHGMVHLGDQVPADEYDCCADAALDALRPELDGLATLRAAVARVRALHVPVDMMAGVVCKGCMNCDPYEAPPWPCRTIEALNGPERPS
jgi:hypothetical protein